MIVNIEQIIIELMALGFLTFVPPLKPLVQCEEIFSPFYVSRKVVDITAYDRLSQVHTTEAGVTIEAAFSARELAEFITIRANRPPPF